MIIFQCVDLELFFFIDENPRFRKIIRIKAVIDFLKFFALNPFKNAIRFSKIVKTNQL